MSCSSFQYSASSSRVGSAGSAAAAVTDRGGTWTVVAVTAAGTGALAVVTTGPHATTQTRDVINGTIRDGFIRLVYLSRLRGSGLTVKDCVKLRPFTVSFAVNVPLSGKPPPPRPP